MYLIIPNEDYAKIKASGLDVPQMRKFKDNEFPENFRIMHHEFNAILVTPDVEKTYQIMGVPQGTAGIVQGYTCAEYARMIGKSRQFVFSLIKQGKLNCERIGKLWVIYGEARNA